MDGASLTIIGTVLAVGVGLAALIMRSTARLDRRIDSDKATADADRRAIQARFDTAMDTFRSEMGAFRSEMRTFEREMLRLAERQSRVEGRLDERGSAAD